MHPGAATFLTIQRRAHFQGPFRYEHLSVLFYNLLLQKYTNLPNIYLDYINVSNISHNLTIRLMVLLRAPPLVVVVVVYNLF